MKTYQYLLGGFLLLWQLTLFAQVGIGTTSPDPSSLLDMQSSNKGVLIPRVSIDNITNQLLDGVNTASTSLLVWNTNAFVIGGDGVGFYFFNNSVWEKLSSQTIIAENGVDLTGSTIRLGGNLTQNTSITQGIYDLNLNLSSTGDFNVQDNGVTHLQVRDNGDTYFGGEVVVTEENDVTGTTIARLYNIFDEDGALYLYRNGQPQHRIDAGFLTVFNDLGEDLDFRIETDTNPNAFYVDAGDDVVHIGNNNAGLLNNGATIANGDITPVIVDYVAAVYQGSTNGTAMQLGSTEYIMDSGNLEMSVYGSWLPYYPMSPTSPFRLGNSDQRWQDVWAIDGTINTSDIRLKKNVKALSYGLSEVLQLQPITYRWKNGPENKDKIGFSAQQLLEIIPEVVATHSYELDKEGGQAIRKENKNLGVYYSDIIPILTKAIQEQQQLIIAQQKANEQLEKRVLQLERKF